MNIFFKLSILIIAIQHLVILPMDIFGEAKIEGGRILGATHYHISRIQKGSDPLAIFYRLSAGRGENVCLGAVSINEVNAAAIAELDQLVDADANFPAIKKALIARCIKRGRVVVFYDSAGNELDVCAHYTGPLNIREANDEVLPLHPRSILDTLEEVEVMRPRYWLLALLGAQPIREVAVRY